MKGYRAVVAIVGDVVTQQVIGDKLPNYRHTSTA